MTKQEVDDLTYEIIGAAIEVHKALGPGLLESTYHKCMMMELKQRNISFESNLIVPVHYKGMEMHAELRCDLFIGKMVVAELKAIDAIAPIHEAQLLTYMKLLNAPKGILINFNCTNIFQTGQKTLVNEIYKTLLQK